MAVHMTRGLKLLGMMMGVVLLLLAGLAIYLKSLDFNDYKPQLQQAVLDATGRTLSIDGRLDLKISLQPSLSVDGVHFGNAPWAGQSDMVNVQRLQAELELLPLLSGRVVVDRVVLLNPEIVLETNARGHGNWEFGTAAASGSKAATTTLPQVGHFLLRDAHVSYRDGKSGELWQIQIPSAELSSDTVSADAPLLFAVQLAYRGMPVSMKGSLTGLQALADNKPVRIELTASVPAVEMQLHGNVVQPLEGRGLHLDISVDGKSAALLARLGGIRLAKDGPWSVHTALRDEGNDVLLEQLAMAAPGMDIGGDVRLRLSAERPYLEAKLNSKRMDLRPWLPEQNKAEASTSSSVEKKGGTAAPRRIFPDTPLDVSALKAFDAGLAWNVGELLTPAMILQAVDVQLSLDKGVLAIAAFKAAVAGGNVRANVSLNAAGSVARLEADLQGRGVLLSRLVGGEEDALMEKGPLDMQIRLQGSGASIAQIMAKLNGRIKINMGEAKVKTSAMNLIGGDVLMTLFNKLNPFSDTPAYTELKCGVAHFRIEDGLMLSENGIAVETARMNILSEGRISLKDESIDLSIGTEPREGLGLNLSNMANVVRLGGTLAEPGVRVDVAKSGMAAARTAGAVMTGGLSLLGEGLFNRVTADSTPCKTALEMK